MIDEPIFETAGQKRARQKRAAAERARQYRARKRNARMPLPRDVDQAWCEASAYWLAKHYAELKAAGQSPADVVMPVATVMKIAVAILERQGNARRQSKIAVAERLGPRPEHEHADYVPSIAPRTDHLAPVRQPKMSTDAGWDDWEALLCDMIAS